jgi:hypothetical protein
MISVRDDVKALRMVAFSSAARETVRSKSCLKLSTACCAAGRALATHQR